MSVKTKLIICPNCQHKIRITFNEPDPPAPAADTPHLMSEDGYYMFEQEGMTMTLFGGSRKLRPITPDAINIFIQPFVKATAFALPLSAISLSLATYYNWSPLVPAAILCTSFPLLVWVFGRKLTWNVPKNGRNGSITSEPSVPAHVQADDDGETDKQDTGLSTEALAWEDVTRTQNGIRLRAVVFRYWDEQSRHVPVRLVQRWAIAVTNHNYTWVDERDLDGIGRRVYRSIREECLERGYAVALPDKRTELTEHGKFMVNKIAATPPL